jgi:divalent metal cation (Fe/Co/Zn/Cd) transporter
MKLQEKLVDLPSSGLKLKQAAEKERRLHQRALRLEWFTVLWNVIQAGVAIVAGVIAGSTALVAFGADSLIEVTSAVGLLWRLYRAKAGASAEEHSAAERKALYVVAATFFALAVYTAYESIPALLVRETPETSMVGLVLSVIAYVQARLPQIAQPIE